MVFIGMAGSLEALVLLDFTFAGIYLTVDFLSVRCTLKSGQAMLQLLQLKLGLETGVELQTFNGWLSRSRVNFFMLLWKGEFQNIDAECTTAGRR